MPFADIYRRQALLLIRLLPVIAEEKCFALKGGTAINLFERNMPRLSVDIIARGGRTARRKMATAQS